MKPVTIIRHLSALVRRLEASNFSTQSEDKAVREAIDLLKPRTGVVDHLDGNPRNFEIENLRIKS